MSGEIPPVHGGMRPARPDASHRPLGEAAAPAHHPAPAAVDTGPTDPRAQRALLADLVRDALEAGRPTQALTLLSLLRRAAPNGLDTLFLHGQALYQLERFLEGAMVASQGLNDHPRSAALLYLVANCEARLGNAPAAERALRAALVLRRDDPTLLCRLADLVLREGRWEESERLLYLALDAMPAHPVVVAAMRGRDHPGAAWASPRPGDLYGSAAVGSLLLAEDQRTEGDRPYGAGAALREWVAAALRRTGDRPPTALGTARLVAFGVGLALLLAGRVGTGLAAIAASLGAGALLGTIRRLVGTPGRSGP
jgi:tetratricopeptide (TPR) repeat protein